MPNIELEKRKPQLKCGQSFFNPRFLYVLLEGSLSYIHNIERITIKSHRMDTLRNISMKCMYGFKYKG